MTSRKRSVALDLFSSALIGVGLVSLAMPAFLYWLIHGDHDRYIWLINGPAPFDQFGSGPFQLWTGAGFIGTGAALVTAGAALRVAPRNAPKAVLLGVSAFVVGSVGSFFLAIALWG